MIGLDLPQGVSLKPWVRRLGLAGELVLALFFVRMDLPFRWFFTVDAQP